MGPELIPNIMLQTQELEANHADLTRTRSTSPSSDTDSVASVLADPIFDIEDDDNWSMYSVDSSDPYDEDVHYDSDGDSEAADDDCYIVKCDKCPGCIPRYNRTMGSIPVVSSTPTVNSDTRPPPAGYIHGEEPLADAGERYAGDVLSSHYVSIVSGFSSPGLWPLMRDTQPGIPTKNKVLNAKRHSTSDKLLLASSEDGDKPAGSIVLTPNDCRL